MFYKYIVDIMSLQLIMSADQWVMRWRQGDLVDNNYDL